MPTTLDIFISSKMVELKEERDALFELIPKLNFGDIKLHAWVFEEDAGAVGKPIRDVYLNALQNSALYLGLFWKQYGEYTIDEFDRATEWGIERHIYVKDVEVAKRTDELSAFLNKHGAVTSGITAKWFKTTDELCAAVQRSIENWISDRLRVRSGSSAIHATHPDDLTEKPAKLFGRDALLAEVRTLLEQRQQVLLQGFGGMGKTAFAATIAANWITDGKGSVLWLRAGSAELDSLAEALARPFNAQQAVASQSGDAKIKALRDILRASGATLLVLDDCWSSKDLLAILKAVPSDMALLATARQRYPLAKIRTVDELAPSDALDLLTHHADRAFTLSPDNEAALGLCDLLGHHAFAVEIAGKTLKSHGWSPTELHRQIKDAPHMAAMPLEFSEAGREDVAKLLEVSLNALDEETRNVFLAFGAFFAPQLTPEMLYRFFIGIPKVSDEQLSAARVDIPQLPSDISDDKLRKMIQEAILDNADYSPAANALEILHLHGLAERLSATDESITVYRIQDLAYSYARAQINDDHRYSALQACLSYTKHYKKSSLANFAALRPELDNLLGAASWAFETEQYPKVEEFAWNLYVRSQFLVYRGFFTVSVRLLEQAVHSALQAGNKRNQAAHLGNLATAYGQLGQANKATLSNQQALTISREIGDRMGESIQLGNLGISARNLGYVEQGIAYHEQALTISREIGDRKGESNHLGNLGIAFNQLGYIEQAISHSEQGLTISREIGDKYAESSHLGNLSICFHSLGSMEQAILYSEQALIISREIGDKQGESKRLSALGNVYSDLGQINRAASYHHQAMVITREIGDKRSEASDLNNLGNVYRDLGQLEQAFSYFEQALTISREIGDKQGEATILGNFGIAYNQIGQLKDAISYHQKAISISREIGYKQVEGMNLGGLGAAYGDLGEAVQAIIYFHQAREIFIAMGAQHLVAKIDENLAIAQSKLVDDNSKT